MSAPLRRVLAGVIAALLAVGAWAASADSTSTQPGVRALAATAGSNEVTVTGWATFSGAVIATGTSKVGNAGPTGEASGADLIRADFVYRPELADFFIRLALTSIPSVGIGPGQLVGDPGVLYGLRTTVGGTPIEVRVQSTVAGPLFGLFTCKAETACVQAASLQGGFGTTGKEVVVALPLATIVAAGMPIKEGDKVGSPVAFTARSPYLAGVVDPALLLDAIAMAKTVNVTVPVRSVRVTVGKLTKTVAVSKGQFSVSFPRSYFLSQTTTVTTRGCLGARCILQRFPVHV